MRYFITFGAGDKNYYEAGERLLNQANNIQLFDKTIFYTDADLKADTEFWNQHSNFIENNKRGYGYWIWKPYLIKKTMEQMNNGDILLYLDCGCEIDIRMKHVFNRDLELIKNEYVMGTTVCIEREWNKMDLLKKLDVLDSKYLNTPQCQSGANLILVCDKTRELINKWYELACDYHNIDDSPSIEPNLSCFKEHRHDQSVYSLLLKKYNLFSIHPFSSIRDWRNRSGVSQIHI